MNFTTLLAYKILLNAHVKLVNHLFAHKFYSLLFQRLVGVLKRNSETSKVRTSVAKCQKKNAIVLVFSKNVQGKSKI